MDRLRKVGYNLVDRRNDGPTNGFNGFNGSAARAADGIVPALWISSEEIRCVSPALPPSTPFVAASDGLGAPLPPSSPLEVSLNRKVMEHAGGRTTAITSPRLTIHANPLAHHQPATHTRTHPPAPPPRQDFTAAGLHFQYHGPITLLDATPGFGSTDGGTRVTVRGTGFHNWPTLSCRFGYDVVAARWLDSNHLECSTTAHTPGSVALTVSLNGYEFVPVGTRTLTFGYNLGVGVASVEPTSGLLSGGTRVVVSGSGFTNTTELACRFGTETAPFATFVDSGHVVCPSPRAAVRAYGTDGTVSVPVSVTSNGIDFATETARFRYMAVPVVTAVKPSVLAPEYRRPEDTPRTVLLSGARFFDSAKIRCQFSFSSGSGVDVDGGGAKGGGGDSVQVLGRWLSSSLLLCPVPQEGRAGFRSLIADRDHQ